MCGDRCRIAKPIYIVKMLLYGYLVCALLVLRRNVFKKRREFFTSIFPRGGHFEYLCVTDYNANDTDTLLQIHTSLFVFCVKYSHTPQSQPRNTNEGLSRLNTNENTFYTLKCMEDGHSSHIHNRMGVKTLLT